MPLSSPLLDRSDRRDRLLLGTAASVIIAAGIRLAAPLLGSILLALVVVVAVVPAFDALRRRGVPKSAAVILTTLLLAGAVLMLIGFVGMAGSQLIHILPGYQDKAAALREGLENWMRARGSTPDRCFPATS